MNFKHRSNLLHQITERNPPVCFFFFFLFFYPFAVYLPARNPPVVIWRAGGRGREDREKCGGGNKIKRGGEQVKERALWEYSLCGAALEGRTGGIRMM